MLSKSDHSPVTHHSHVMAILPVFRRTGFHRSGVFHISKCSGVRIVFWILLQLDILCTSAVKRCCAKNDNSPFKCHLFSRVLEFMKARKTCHRVVRTSIWSNAYSGELCNKNCIVKTSETLIIWCMCCYTAGSGKWDAIKGVPDRLLKRAAMVFKVQSRHGELMLTYWCS